MKLDKQIFYLIEYAGGPPIGVTYAEYVPKVRTLLAERGLLTKADILEAGRRSPMTVARWLHASVQAMENRVPPRQGDLQETTIQTLRRELEEERQHNAALRHELEALLLGQSSKG